MGALCEEGVKVKLRVRLAEGSQRPGRPLR